MKKIILILLILVMFISHSCSNDKEEYVVNDNTEEAKPSDSIEEIDTSDSHFGEGIEILFDTNEYRIFKYTVPMNQNISISTSLGAENGKIIFKEFINEKGKYKYGFLNYDFTSYVDAVYDEVWPFDNGVAIVMEDNKFGAIGLQGYEIIPCEYDYSPIIIDNTIQVLIKSGNGYMEFDYFNKQDGAYLFKEISLYSEISSVYTTTRIFPNGASEEVMSVDNKKYPIRPVYNSKKNKWGYKNNFGELVTDYIYDEAGYFVYDIAIVKIDEGYGYIDIDGNMVISCIYDEAYPFSNGIARVKQDGEYMFIDISNDWISPETFKNANDFSDEYAAISTISPYWGYIDKDGVKMVDEKFLYAGPYECGYAVVKDIDKKPIVAPDEYDVFYYIDKTGLHSFNEMEFSVAAQFSEGGYALMQGVGDIAGSINYYSIQIKNE